MPYNKRSYRRYRSRRYKRKPITYGQIGSKIWRDVRWLKSVINVEKKYLDITFNNTISETENFQLLNGMQTGDTSSTREGQSIKCVVSFCRFYMTMNSSATTTQIRIMIFIDTQPNATTATSAELLASTTNILSPLTIGYGSRFKILCDKIFRLDTNKLNLEYKMYKKLGFHTKYNSSNNGTIADITKNAFYIMMVSDQATNTPTVSFWHRLRFIDN